MAGSDTAGDGDRQSQPEMAADRTQEPSQPPSQPPPQPPRPARNRRPAQKQPQQWYQAQPIPQTQNYQSLCPAPIPFSEPWHRAKNVLSAVSLLASTVLIAISVALVVILGFSELAWETFAAVVALAGAAMLWQLAESITLCARRERRGIHPGAHVGLQLVISLGAILVMGFTATSVAYLAEIPAYYYDGNSEYFYGYNGYIGCYSSTQDCGAYARQALSMHAALLAFIVILLIVHFTLFIRACVETHQRNSRNRTIIVVPSGALTMPMSNVYMVQPTAQPQYVYAPRQQPTMSTAGARGNSSVLERQTPGGTVKPGTTRSMSDAPSLHGFYAPQRESVGATHQSSHAPIAGVQESSRGKGKEVAPPQLDDVAEDVSPIGSDAGDRRSTHDAIPSGSGLKTAT